MKSWNNETVKAFHDDNETKFERGPFTINGIEYDYKLTDKNGEDYCTTNQMESWDVDMIGEINI